MSVPFLPAPSLTVSSPTQGLVSDIYYRGTEAEVQRCTRPDGRVPLVQLWGPRGKGGFAFLFGAEPRSF